MQKQNHPHTYISLHCCIVTDAPLFDAVTMYVKYLLVILLTTYVGIPFDVLVPPTLKIVRIYSTVTLQSKKT